MTAADSHTPRQDTLQLAVRRRGSAARVDVSFAAVFGVSNISALWRFGRGRHVAACPCVRASVPVAV